MCNQIAFRVHCRLATRSSWMKQPTPATMKQEARRHSQGHDLSPCRHSGVFAQRQLNQPCDLPATLAPFQSGSCGADSNLARVHMASGRDSVGCVLRPTSTAWSATWMAARLLNAVAATGVKPKPMQNPSIPCDRFQQGLGRPGGCRPRAFKRLHSGSLALEASVRRGHEAGGNHCRRAVYALNHHVERLAEDKRKRPDPGTGSAEIEGIVVEPVETNLIFFDVSAMGVTAEAFNAL